MLKNLAIKGFIGLSCLAALTGVAGCGDVSTHSIYEFQVDNVTQINVNEQTNIDVTLKATNIRSEGYDKVLIKVDATNKDIRIRLSEIICIEGTDALSAISLGKYNNEEEADEIFNKILEVIKANKGNDLIIEMPEKRNNEENKNDNKA